MNKSDMKRLKKIRQEWPDDDTLWLLNRMDQALELEAKAEQWLRLQAWVRVNEWRNVSIAKKFGNSGVVFSLSATEEYNDSPVQVRADDIDDVLALAKKKWG